MDDQRLCSFLVQLQVIKLLECTCSECLSSLHPRKGSQEEERCDVLTGFGNVWWKPLAFRTTSVLNWHWFMLQEAHDVFQLRWIKKHRNLHVLLFSPKKKRIQDSLSAIHLFTFCLPIQYKCRSNRDVCRDTGNILQVLRAPQRCALPILQDI